ncbi:MAG: SDR family oxidoreductase [Gluconacetobacter diazotrophicus]|nr:SDR family oxidoreductase [Gluconacetobacter diazotrophicus]
MSQDHADLHRRLLLGGSFAGGLAALMPAARADEAPGAPVSRDANNTTEYARPPFAEQQQPWPGLAGKMQPRPDHGETSYRGSGRLAGRRALVTGGDSGIGRAAVIAFAREGADVAFNYLPAEEPDAREVVELIEGAGRKAYPLPGDLRDANFCRQLVGDAVAKLGGLDILVSNAAMQHAAPDIESISDEQFDDTFRCNVYALFHLCKAAMPHLKPGASIIATSSVNAYDPGEVIIDYAATKAAIANFCKGLAKQVAHKGIRVNAVAPGPFWTPLQVTGGQPANKLPQFGAQTPIGRPGQPAELAPVYVLLASNEASYITGQVYGAVGGHGGP